MNNYNYLFLCMSMLSFIHAQEQNMFSFPLPSEVHCIENDRFEIKSIDEMLNELPSHVVLLAYNSQDEKFYSVADYTQFSGKHFHYLLVDQEREKSVIFHFQNNLQKL